MSRTFFRKLKYIINGENSGVEFKRDNIRPEQLAKEIVATREEQACLFQEGGFLHVEILPAPGADFSCMDHRRLEDYFGRIRKLQPLPQTEPEWIELLTNMEFMTTDSRGKAVCTIAGILLFGRRPKRFLYQAGLQWAVFSGREKDYDTRDRATLDGPLAALWDKNGEQIEDGLFDKLISGVRQHGSCEKLAENHLTRTVIWDYPPEAVREAIINAFAHRD